MLILFTLVLARVSGLLIGAPVLSSRSLPRRYSAMLALVLAASLLPAARPSALPEDGYAMVSALATEMATGFAIGLLARLLLTAFQTAGSVISFQMGFAMARTFDPNSGAQSPVIATIHLQLVTMLFLLLDGHHLLLRSVAASYETFPIGMPLQSGLLTQTLFSASGTMYEAAARVAGPVTGLMLLINSLVGLLNRLVPQLSIFNIGFPLTVATGLVAVAYSIPEVVSFFLRAYGSFEGQLAELLLR